MAIFKRSMNVRCLEHGKFWTSFLGHARDITGHIPDIIGTIPDLPGSIPNLIVAILELIGAIPDLPDSIHGLKFVKNTRPGTLPRLLHFRYGTLQVNLAVFQTLVVFPTLYEVWILLGKLK